MTLIFADGSKKSYYGYELKWVELPGTKHVTDAKTLDLLYRIWKGGYEGMQSLDEPVKKKRKR